MTAFVDSNVLVRHLTGDPPDQAKRAGEFLRTTKDLILVDLVVAEVVYVLESVYAVERERIAELVRAIIGFRAVAVPDEALLLRALELYELYRIHFAELYLAACAELSGVGVVASFDSITRLSVVSPARRLQLLPQREQALEPEKEAAMTTKIAEVMTDRPRAITPQTSIREAARLMEEEDVGSLPIVDDGTRLVGIVTDRDIAIRAVGRGHDPEQTGVSEIASEEVYALTPDDDLDDALQTMARAQVRRVPVVVRENELVGMISQADIARVSKEKTTGELVEAISQSPRGPRVAGADSAGGRGVGRSDTLGERDDPARDRATVPTEAEEGRLN